MIEVNGLWIPEGDTQLRAMLTGDADEWKRPLVDGEKRWHWNHIGPALKWIRMIPRRM